jgi:uncharacterized protein (DUF2062 family)
VRQLSRRIRDAIVAQLQQGITPDKIALTLALGGVLGVFPILGSSTLLCAIAGVWLRLNQPLIQLTNYLVYPLQLLFLLPFYRAGETLFGQPHVPIFSVIELVDRFRAAPLQFVVDYGLVALYGIVVWCLVAPLAGGALYYSLRPVLHRLSGQVRAA